MNGGVKELSIHLWREWREHRRSLYLLAACLVLVVAGLSRLVPESTFRDPVVVRWIARLVLATVTLAIGSDLFANERQRGTLDFLRRTPGGLAGAFRAKLVFFVLLLVGATLFGHALGAAAALSRTGTWPEGAFDPGRSWELALAGFGLLWIFAVSTWVRSGALTVPATMLFLVGVLWPWWVITTAGGIYGIGEPLLWSFVALSACGAVASAWVSFVHGGRRGRSRRHATLTGLVTAGLFFTPAWAWAGGRYLELQEREMVVGNISLGEGHRLAFVNLRRVWEHGSRAQEFGLATAVLLDLESGELSLAGDLDGSIWNNPTHLSCARSVVSERGWPVMELYDEITLGFSEPTLVDGASGATFEGEACERIDSYWNERNWPQAFELQAQHRSYISQAGAGFCVMWRGSDESWQKLYWDPASDRVVDLARLPRFDREQDFREVYVRPGRWLAQSPHRRWLWLDPQSGETEVVACMRAKDRVSLSFDDGSLLVLRDDIPLLLDPQTGELREFEVRGALGERVLFQSVDGPRGRGSLPARRRTAVRVLAMSSGVSPIQRTGVALVDPVAGVIEVLEFGFENKCSQGILASGPGFALMAEGSQLLRIDSDSGEVRVLLDLEHVGQLLGE